MSSNTYNFINSFDESDNYTDENEYKHITQELKSNGEIDHYNPYRCDIINVNYVTDLKHRKLDKQNNKYNVRNIKYFSFNCLTKEQQKEHYEKEFNNDCLISTYPNELEHYDVENLDYKYNTYKFYYSADEGIKTQVNNSMNIMNSLNKIDDKYYIFKTPIYENLPYEGFNNGVSYIKYYARANKHYQNYIHPFIDFDLKLSDAKYDNFDDIYKYEFIKLINKFKEVFNIDNEHKRISAVGYSNMLTKDFKPIKAVPDASKCLSVHVVFYEVVIEARQFKYLIDENIEKFKKITKAFDSSKFTSLRHMASPKIINDKIETNKAIPMTFKQIQNQFITFIKPENVFEYQIIEIDVDRVRAAETKRNKPIKEFKPFNPNCKYSIKYLNVDYTNNVEELIKKIIEEKNNVIDFGYTSKLRFKLLCGLKMFKSNPNFEILEHIIIYHEHIKSQFESIKINTNGSPYYLFKTIKSINSGVEYEIENNKLHFKKFGTLIFRELEREKNFKSLIEKIPGCFGYDEIDKRYFALAEEGKLIYFDLNSRNHYGLFRNIYCYIDFTDKPKKPKKESEKEEQEEPQEQTNEYIETLMEYMRKKKAGNRFRITFGDLFNLVNRYIKSPFLTAYNKFKLIYFNYNIPKETPKANEIIELFRNRIENKEAFDEMLESIAYTIQTGNKFNKIITVIGTGNTGKSTLFQKIIAPIFGNQSMIYESLKHIQSSFSDNCNYIYNLYNEVETDKKIDGSTSHLKMMADGGKKSEAHKFVQGRITYFDNSINVILSNSQDLKNLVDFSDSAMVSRLLFIKFKTFINEDGTENITTEANNYFKPLDKYKDNNNEFKQELINEMYAYFMNLKYRDNINFRVLSTKYANDVAKSKIYDELEGKNIEIDGYCIYSFEHKDKKNYIEYHSSYDDDDIICFRANLIANTEIRDKFKKIVHNKIKYTNDVVRLTLKINGKTKEEADETQQKEFKQGLYNFNKRNDNKCNLIVTEYKYIKPYIKSSELN